MDPFRVTTSICGDAVAACENIAAAMFSTTTSGRQMLAL